MLISTLHIHFFFDSFRRRLRRRASSRQYARRARIQRRREQCRAGDVDATQEDDIYAA